MERTPTGVEGLDKMLNGGLPAGRPYIVTGPPGSGKSILGTHFLLEGMRNGEACMLVALDEPPSEIKTNMATFGWNLDALTTVDATPDIKSHKKKNVIDVGTALDVRGMDQVTDVRKSMQLRTQEVTIHSVQKMIKQSARDLRERVAGGHFSRILIDSMTALKRFSLKSEDARILRPSLLRLVGDEGGDLTLRSDAQKLALEWLADHKATSPELASAALYLAAIASDAPLHDKLHAAAKAEPDRVERQRILEAMGAVRAPELVQRNFAIFLSDEFNAREAVALLTGAESDPRGQEALFAFVQENFDAIAAKLPRDFAAVLPYTASHFCDDEHATAVGRFFRPKVADHPGMQRALAQTMEGIRQCAIFKAKQAPGLAAFLTK